VHGSEDIVIIDHTAFFNRYRAEYGRLTQSVVSGLELLGRNMEVDPDLKNLQWAAYMLATVKHECAGTWQPIVERGQKSYFDKYETGTPIGRRLGNLEPGDGWRFRGRGYVQITGRANYARMTKELGLAPDADLVQDPEQALRPAIAYQIMSVGMRKGLFTGKKLGDYISASGCDYKNARRIINGVDQAALIAQYAVTIEGILRAAIVR
jgi:putative chitinase